MEWWIIYPKKNNLLQISSPIFDELKGRKLFYSYFQVDQTYYILVFHQKSFDPEFLYQSLNHIPKNGFFVPFATLKL